jgi:hypothetical protein
MRAGLYACRRFKIRTRGQDPEEGLSGRGVLKPNLRDQPEAFAGAGAAPSEELAVSLTANPHHRIGESSNSFWATPTPGARLVSGSVGISAPFPFRQP